MNKSNFSAQQWKVKQSKKVEGPSRGRGGGKGYGKPAYVQLYQQTGTTPSPLFVFSKCKQTCKSSRCIFPQNADLKTKIVTKGRDVGERK